MALAFSPDGSKLAATVNVRDLGRAVRVRVVDARTGQELAALDGEGWVLALAWSADGKHVAAGRTDGKAVVWDAETFQVRHVLDLGENGQGTAVAFDPAGGGLAVGVFRWKATTPNTAAYEYSSEVRFYDPATGAERQRLPGGAGERFAALAFAPGGGPLLGGVARTYHPAPAGRPVGGVRVWEHGE
jgi:WD40 repeat protein